MKYSIVIVTYNRCELLKEAVTCALSQQVKPSHIIIVNNNSTDGTKEYLDSIKNSLIVVKHLKENCGGAGGFYYGIKLAHRLGDDWHLIIDDDAMLSKDYVLKLSRFIKKYDNIGCVAGTVVTDGNIVTDHRQKMAYPGFRFKKIPKEEYKKKVFTCDTASFCGIMIKDSIVGKIGYPQKDYFIWYDDTEYCVRIRKYTKIAVVTSAILNHKTAQAQETWPRHYTWKDYYGIRNRIQMVDTHGNIVDKVYNRVYMWVNIWLRNKLFSLVKLHGEDWSFELDTYNKAIKSIKKCNE